MTVAEQIRTARISKDLSLRALAAQLKVTHTTIHAWETGRAPVPEWRVRTICAILELDVNAVKVTWKSEREALDAAQLERHRERLAARRST
jgi:transcriptional regulator with XRE-family HTH domain